MRLISNKILLIFFGLVLLCGYKTSAQAWDISGFLSKMPYYTWKKHEKSYLDNLVHNRIRIKRSYESGIVLNLELRNRFIWGSSIKKDATRRYIIGSDPGAIDMSINLGSGNSYVVNSYVDRLMLKFKRGNFIAVVGRQRVEWGVSRIWNPNDIFNIYSFYDFDYRAKPSMDGVSLAYGSDDKKLLNTVVKVDSNNRLSGAIMYRSEVGRNTSMQLMSGVIKEEDYFVGYGLRHKNNEVEIYSEISYFFPSSGNSSDDFVATVGGIYKVGKLKLGLEYLYSDYLEEDRGDIDDLIQGRVSLKNLSIVDHTYNISLGYQFSEKVESSFDFIGYGYPMFDGGYIGTTSKLNFNKSLSLSGVIQLYKQDWLPQKSMNAYCYVRLRKEF